MPLLTGDDPLPARPQRIVVAGTSGSGKTTLAGRIGELLQIPHVEIDGLFHGPHWTPRPEFEDDVRRFAATERWVTEWQYTRVRPLLAERADLMVWLDLPQGVVLQQLVWRTVRRRLARTPLWNGNREPPLRTFFTNPDHIVRWARKTHGRSAVRVAALLRDRPELPIVRVQSRSALELWVAGPLQQVATR